MKIFCSFVLKFRYDMNEDEILTKLKNLEVFKIPKNLKQE